MSRLTEEQTVFIMERLDELLTESYAKLYAVEMYKLLKEVFDNFSPTIDSPNEQHQEDILDNAYDIVKKIEKRISKEEQE